MTPEQRIGVYRPDEAGMQLLKATDLVLLVGITGSGKNTILSEMVQTGKFHDLVTTISRPPRSNNGIMERDGVDYHFVTEDQASEMLVRGEYVEVSLVHGRIYGVTVAEIQRSRDEGKRAIADVDVQGVAKFKQISGRVTAIFLVPPSYHEWQRRVRQRYINEDQFRDDWPNRRSSAIMELEKALAAPYYHFVINDNLQDAVSACLKIASSRDHFARKDDEMRLRARDILEAIKRESQEG